MHKNRKMMASVAETLILIIRDAMAEGSGAPLLSGCDMAAYALRYSPSFKGKNKPTAEALIKAAQENQVGQQVGWLGNFNDMALKTVIRRLLSKYGYLSVEMQNAISKDTEEHAETRDEIISNSARQEITLDETQYTVVDVETGEIKEEPAGPDY